MRGTRYCAERTKTNTLLRATNKNRTARRELLQKEPVELESCLYPTRMQTVLGITNGGELKANPRHRPDLEYQPSLFVVPFIARSVTASQSAEH